MRVEARGAAAFCARPPAGLAGALLWGEDAAAVAALREALVVGALGADAEREMRVDRLTAGALRADPAALDAALRARGFFGGRRAVVATEATDALAPALLAALDGAAGAEALLVVSAGALPGRSALRQGFEARARAAAVACDAAPPDAADAAAALRAAGVAAVAGEAAEALAGIGREIGPGAFARLVETLALHHGAERGPLEVADVLACAPQDGGAEIDDAVAAALDGRAEALRALLARLSARGAEGAPVAIAALRRLRLLHRLAAEAGTDGWERAAARLRPPLFGARRDAAIRQARRWPARALEEAIGDMLEADAAARGGSAGPAGAMVERALMRLALRRSG